MNSACTDTKIISEIQLLLAIFIIFISQASASTPNLFIDLNMIISISIHLWTTSIFTRLTPGS